MGCLFMIVTFNKLSSFGSRVPQRPLVALARLAIFRTY
jgi:hypothetical protein